MGYEILAWLIIIGFIYYKLQEWYPTVNMGTYRKPVQKSPVQQPIVEKVYTHPVHTSDVPDPIVPEEYKFVSHVPVQRPIVPATGHKNGRTYLAPEYFIGAWVDSLQISPAEQLIMEALGKYYINWEREVSFRGFTLPTGFHPRYDFYLIDHNTIIEYHGREWHSLPGRAETDQLKADYCRDHDIRLIVWSSRDYYHIDTRVGDLMHQLDVDMIE